MDWIRLFSAADFGMFKASQNKKAPGGRVFAWYLAGRKELFN
jgi:hypothetical protein